MKRQRDKAELLRNMRTYAALKKDAQSEEPLRNKTVYFRMGVVWCTTLWKEENFSANELFKFQQYIKDNDVTNLTDEKRKSIQEKIHAKKIDWYLRCQVNKQKKRNDIDQAINDLEYYNSRACVDYSLLACEYLIDYKKYGKKRLDRVIGDIFYLDNAQTKVIWQMRQDLFDNKGIWIELSNDDVPEGAEVI